MTAKTNITTKLEGTEKQVAWAEDIRERMVALLAYSAEEARQLADEAREMYADNPKRQGTVARKERMAQQAAERAEKLTAALADVTDARWFIDNRDANVRGIRMELAISGYTDENDERLRPVETVTAMTQTTETEVAEGMRKQLTVTFTQNATDMLGNAGNVETSIEFIGAESFVTMTFGGRDGMQRDSVTLAELRDIFARIGVDC